MLKILVVEDHALVREGLLTTLKHLGAETQTFGVADANAAIGVLEVEDIDLVILDLMLPGKDGIEPADFPALFDPPGFDSPEDHAPRKAS